MFANPRMAAMMAAESQNTNENHYWYSFADPELPEGSRFLGVAIVKAKGIILGLAKCHELGINPGGEALMFEIPPEKVEERIKPEYLNKLLSKEDLEKFDLI